MVADKEEIHRLSLSANIEDSFIVARKFIDEHRSHPYTSADWNDLLSLTSDVDFRIRYQAGYIIGCAFEIFPEEHKSVAWEYLHRLTSNENSNVR